MGLIELLRWYHIVHTWEEYEEAGSARTIGSETGQQNYDIVQDVNYWKRCSVCGKERYLGSGTKKVGEY